MDGEVVTCPDCGGSGYDGGYRCCVCGGTGKVEKATGPVQVVGYFRATPYCGTSGYRICMFAEKPQGASEAEDLMQYDALEEGQSMATGRLVARQEVLRADWNDPKKQGDLRRGLCEAVSEKLLEAIVDGRLRAIHWHPFKVMPFDTDLDTVLLEQRADCWLLKASDAELGECVHPNGGLDDSRLHLVPTGPIFRREAFGWVRES